MSENKAYMDAQGVGDVLTQAVKTVMCTWDLELNHFPRPRVSLSH